MAGKRKQDDETQTPAEDEAVGAAADEKAPEDVGESETQAAPGDEPEADAPEDVQAETEETPPTEEVEETITAEEPPAGAAPAKRRKRTPRAQRPAKTRKRRSTSAKPKGERRPIVRVPKPERRRGKRKERRGVVVSAAMEKTIVVRVESAKPHPMYKKVVRRSVKFHAHDEKNVAKPGDVVRIVETPPRSKTKRWQLVEVLEEAR